MENYEILGMIGKGNFGSISKVKRKSDNRILVWKELDYGKMTEKEKQHIVAEVNILRELKHPNIVRYYDRIIDKKNTKIYIVMEYCEGGDIGALIKRCKKNSEYIAEDVIWKIFTQIVLALHECHTRKEGKILHRDLKPSNVFLDKENNVKLGDFGLSRVLSSESSFAYSHVGTPYYMSPEQIDEAKYNEKSDIWSLGCYMYELTTFNPPFEATNHLSLALKIKNGKVERINSRYSDELSRVINWMLLVDQDKRPSVEDLLNLPQVSLRLRERRLKDTMTKLKKIEENLKQKENELMEKENELIEREKVLSKRESLVNKKEAELNETRIKPHRNDTLTDKKRDVILNKNNSNIDSKPVQGILNSNHNNFMLQNEINPDVTKKEIENITYSINSHINQNTVNLNYLNLLNNKDNININYNINNKIKFENNYDKCTDRLKHKPDSNIAENYQEKNENQMTLGQNRENFIQKINPLNKKNHQAYISDIYTNISYNNNNNNNNYYSNNNNYNNTNNTISSEHKTPNLNSLGKHNDPIVNQNIDNKIYNDKIQSNESDTLYTNTCQLNTDKNFKFDPSLYRENLMTKNMSSPSSIREDIFSTPNSNISKINNTNCTQNIHNDHRENVLNNLSKPPNRMMFTASPIVNTTKSLISKTLIKHASHGQGDYNSISTITSTPQISNRATNNLSVTKSSLISCSNNLNANINKYSSILTRDRSFSPSAASNYKRKNFKPPLSFINNK